MCRDNGCVSFRTARKDEANKSIYMSIPDYQSLMLPLLKTAADGKVHTKREALNELAAQFGLTENERKELLPSGNQAILDNRLGWARTYLKKAGLIQYTQRGHFQLTDRGKAVLAQKPNSPWQNC